MKKPGIAAFDKDWIVVEAILTKEARIKDVNSRVDLCYSAEDLVKNMPLSLLRVAELFSSDEEFGALFSHPALQSKGELKGMRDEFTKKFSVLLVHPSL